MRTRLLLLVTSLAIALFAQSTADVVYVESFHHEPTRIVEDSFEAHLTPRNPVYRQHIKDAQGADRYTFSITPQGPEGDTKITSWQVMLEDPRHPIYGNLLRASRRPEDDPANEAKNSLWRLEPSNFALVSAGAKRIIKVDGFYVVFQMKAHHFTPPDSPYLDSMTVAVELRNTDPRLPKAPEK
jgi:hypothetical protein